MINGSRAKWSFPYLVKGYICMYRRRFFILLLHTSSSSPFQKKFQENSRTSPKLHSNPLYFYIYLQNKFKNIITIQIPPRNQEEQEKNLLWTVAGLSACYSRSEDCLFRVFVQFQAYTPSISSLVINVEAIFRSENA